jgi:carbamoyl-phosphate synthase large subunit
MLQNKRIFVSGGAGVIGQELIPKLNSLGAKVLVGDLKPCPSHFPENIHYLQGDLNYLTKDILEEFSPDVFIHLAATFERSTESYSFWEENFWHNVRLSHHLATLVKDLPSITKVINASSYLIYNPELYSFSEPQTVPYSLKESDPIYPRNLTGMAKLAHEIEIRFLQSFAGESKSYINARIYRGYGKGSRCVISRWIRSLINGEEIKVYRKEGIFDYIYAGDTAEGLIQLAAHQNASGIINLGTGKARKVQDVVDVLRKYFPEMKYSEHDSDIPYEASQADISLLKSLTNWEPANSLENVIPEIIEYERSHPELASKPPGNVFLSSVSKKVPMVNALKQACRKINNEILLFGGDLNENALGKYFCDGFWNMPRINQLSINEFIQFCKSQNITAVVPSRDMELSYFAKHKSELFRNGIHAMISSHETIEICLDKLRFYDELSLQKFPVIPTYNSITDDSIPRWVVKERFGSGSTGLAVNVESTEALQFAQKLENPIFQPFISGIEYSIDAFVSASGKVKGIVCRTRDLVVSGESQISSTLNHPGIEELINAILTKCSFYGHVVFQVIESLDKQLHIIECNPRFGGASSLSLAVGLDSFYWFLLESIGQNIDNYPFIRSKSQKRQVRYASDMILDH